MGIPRFGKRVVENCPEVVKKIITNVLHLFMDYNSLVHLAAANVAKQHKFNPKYPDKYEKLILNEVIKLTHLIIEMVKPKHTIFISIDGVAPCAKMKQQASRRTKGPLEQYLTNQIKTSLGVAVEPAWDKSAITPGTPFMNKLTEHIRLDIETSKKIYHGKTVMLSDSNDPGEGEHKIFNYIKRNLTELKVDDDVPDKTEKIVVYGLDADLIMLSLASHCNTIFLLRESQEFTKEGNSTEFLYLDIYMFKQCLVTDIKNQLKELVHANNVHFIDDFVFMAFMLGNDFLPHFPTLEIKVSGKDGIDKLLSIYASIYKKRKTHLVKITDRYNPEKIKVDINVDFLKDIIAEISSTENDDMYEHYMKRRHTRPMQPDVDFPSELEIKLNELRFMPVYHIGTELKLHIDGSKDWKKRYYNYYLRKTRTVDDINEICKDYLAGLKWVLEYYFTATHSWGWYYPHIGPPTFDDLRVYLNKNSYPDINDPIKTPVTPFEQLLIVLPRTSSHLLPAKLGKLMTDPKSALFKYYPDPTKIKLNFIFKRYLWEAEPLITPVDYNMVHDAVSKTDFTDAEKNLNSYRPMQVFHPKK